MVTGTKFRDSRSRGLLYFGARKFEPVTTFAESTISATGSYVVTWHSRGGLPSALLTNARP